MLPVALRKIADEIDSARATLLEGVKGVPQRRAEWRSAAGEWSICETLDHLIRAEAGCGRLVAALAKQGRPPYPRDVTEFAWTPPTAAGQRWLVPVPDVAAPGPVQPIEHLVEGLRAQDQWTTKALERLTEVDPRAATAPHPIIGPMNLAQWCRFIAYHLRVHTAQVEEIKRAPGFLGR
ncbi:MAG: DinB family protein [Candidatus Rokuibacteriota bacterium]